MKVKLTPAQKILFRELNHAWLRLYQTTIAVPAHEVRNQLLFSMPDCLRWKKLDDVAAMKKALTAISSIASRERLSDEFYVWLDKITDLVSELGEPNA